MTPILKNVLFKPFPSEEKTLGGIIVSDAHKEVNNKGTIVAVGNKVTKVKVGEVGFRVKNWGDEVMVNGEKHYLMDESAILSIQ